MLARCHSPIPIVVVRGAGAGRVKASEMCIFSAINAWHNAFIRPFDANHQPLAVTIWGEAGFRFCGDPMAIIRTSSP